LTDSYDIFDGGASMWALTVRMWSSPVTNTFTHSINQSKTQSLLYISTDFFYPRDAC